MLHLEANPYLQREKYLYHSSEYHAGEGFRPHDHEFCEFFVVLEGELEQTLNGRSAVLPAGTVQLLLPGDAHGRSSCGTILSRHAVPALTTPTVTPA